MCSANIHGACFNPYFAACELYDLQKSHDDPLRFSSEGHADPIYHRTLGSCAGTLSDSNCRANGNDVSKMHTAAQNCNQNVLVELMFENATFIKHERGKVG